MHIKKIKNTLCLLLVYSTVSGTIVSAENQFVDGSLRGNTEGIRGQHSVQALEKTENATEDNERAAKNAQILSEIERLAENGEYEQLQELVQSSLKNGIKRNKLLKVAKKTSCTPLKNTLRVLRRKNIFKKQAKLSKEQLFEIVWYVETNQDKKWDFVSKEDSGFSFDIEQDNETKRVFIHLPEKIGAGYQKIVTKALMYHSGKVEMVANCATTSTIDREVDLLKKVQGRSGIITLYGDTKRPMGDRNLRAVFCKLYNQGSIQSALDRGIRFSFDEKIDIAYSLLNGLETMHKEGIAHMDLGLRNHLVDVQIKGEKRKVRAVVTDFGRAHLIAGLKSVNPQGNSAYKAPESAFSKRMKGEDYFKTDAFALGAGIYRIFYDKPAPWIKETSKLLGRRPPLKTQQELFDQAMDAVEYFHGQMQDYFSDNPDRRKVEEIIVGMVHPDSKKRMSVHDARNAFKKLRR